MAWKLVLLDNNFNFENRTMRGSIEKAIENYIYRVGKDIDERVSYFLFRLAVGVLLFSHGMQKTFGSFGGVDGVGGVAEPISLLGLTGVIELFGGLLIAVGFFVRFAALVLAALMLVVYILIFIPMDPNPLVNGGELTTLFFFTLLLMTGVGAGRWSLEKRIFGDETF